MIFFGFNGIEFNPSNVNSLKCVSMSNQECKRRKKIIVINNNEPMFYPFSIKVNKCSGSCNGINDSYAKLCVPDIIKNINMKVFNLISRISETRHTIWHKMKTSADVNVKNQLTKEYVTKDLFGILVIVSVNVINHVT